MSTVYRATEDGVCTSLGGLLSIGDDYSPPVERGAVHSEDQAHIDAGRLVPLDDRTPDENGVITDEPASDPVKTKPATRGKQEA